MRPVFPFPAIVGLDDAKLALMAVAVNPGIGGVLLRGDKGTGKTTLVRSFADVLPEIEVVADCPFNCHPRDPRLMCDSCLARYRSGENLPVVRRKMRVVDLPLSITVDRLVGTLDVKRALKEGIRALQPGLLAEANRNILYIDEVNLLDDYIVDVILDAAAYGWNIVEREGISVRHPARFILVGSMNPEEGELRPQLLDRFGLVIDVEAPRDPKVRKEIVRRVEEYNADPEGFYEKWRPEIERLRNKIVRAQGIINEVEISDDLLDYLTQAIVEMGIKTCRAEIVTVRTAKAIAALNDRKYVTIDDLKKAMELALRHRIREKPFEEGPFRKPQMGRGVDKSEVLSHNGLDAHGQGGYKGDRKMEGQGGSGGGRLTGNLPGDRGASEIRGFDSVNACLIRPNRRALNEEGIGFKSKASYRREVGGKCGIAYSYMPSPGRYDDVNIPATIANAVVRNPRLPIEIEDEDIVVNIRKVRSPLISIILLDASGSMNFARKIEIAKGIVYKAIENSYIRRSYVALISFRRHGVDIVHGPTRNYWGVLRVLEGLSSGGSTPLSHALKYTIEFIDRNKKKLKGDYVVYLISDGKANVSLYGNIQAELELLLRELRKRARLIFVPIKRGAFEPGITYADLISRYANDVYEL